MDEYIKGETYRFGNVTVNVHRPVLTPAERMRREQQVKDTMARVMREYIHNKEGKQDAKHPDSNP